jgi:hypothetical protein
MSLTIRSPIPLGLKNVQRTNPEPIQQPTTSSITLTAVEQQLFEGRVTEIDIPEAIYWSRKFVTIPRSELPYLVTQELERIESSDRSLSNLQVEEDWDAEEASLPAQRLADSNVAAESFPADENNWFSAQKANSDEYLELDIPFEKIEIVDTKSIFQKFMQEIRLEVSPAVFFICHLNLVY